MLSPMPPPHPPPGASPSDREPVGWPPTLDVTLRMPLRTALQVYANVPQQHRWGRGGGGT